MNKYTPVEFEVISFDAEDVITTSAAGGFVDGGTASDMPNTIHY